ncbi:amidase [Gordonia jinhuaensis]|uniref:amidase n=1 Tax=Gordonia jinhuaensis TaxID=1517702 RepID=A0A916TKR8_9ACTN|nr:amidase [Gordonia jinhuaensis]GGB46019.1 putative amidase AmiB2 [Gordonia jinhuaensis]
MSELVTDTDRTATSGIGRRSLLAGSAVAAAAAVAATSLSAAPATAAPRGLDPHDKSIAFAGVVELARRVRSGEFTARQLTDFFLARIDMLNPTLRAWTIPLYDAARAEADALDAKKASGAKLGPLHGVPIGIKAENHVKGVPTTYGGAAFTKPATDDAEVVKRLRAAGAVILGITAMPEFGIWPFTETSAHGYTRNPWNILHSTAGSSGGTASAVASGMVPAAIGGDGGGSIRLPSSWCGLYGLKLQRGRVSAAPNKDLWKALGVIGPLCRKVEDTALILDCIHGSVPGVDLYSAEPWPYSLTDALRKPLRPLRIALSTAQPAGTFLDDDSRQAILDTGAILSRLGHRVSGHDPVYPATLTAAFEPQVVGGFSTEAHRADHYELLEARTRQGVDIGKATGLSTDVAVSKAIEVGKQVGSQILGSVFPAFDLLICPTTPGKAYEIGQLDGADFVAASAKASPVAAYTSVWNVCGNPAAAVPAGFSDGLPLSVQLVGPPNSEPLLCQVAAALQEVRKWPAHYPPHS